VETPFKAPSRGERVVVVSPHLDDGVLSVGAAMHAWSACGARVELLTVLACDPDSAVATGGWDRRGGFATEGESARARREEDVAACAAVGATPVWLPFGSVDYERHGTDDEVVEDTVSKLGAPDLVLVPGFPLSHPDHRWLVDRLLASSAVALLRTAFYAEQPYTARADGIPSGFTVLGVGSRDRLAKWRGIRCYRSQLPLLALGGRRATAALARKPELVAGRLD